MPAKPKSGRKYFRRSNLSRAQAYPCTEGSAFGPAPGTANSGAPSRKAACTEHSGVTGRPSLGE
eukprot:2902337-Heterocapsa_arctica.AAC.1